jgi:hypothetical protein
LATALERPGCVHAATASASANSRPGARALERPRRPCANGLDREALMVFLLVLLTLGWCLPALAYADPGTGALLWQIMVAVLAGVMFKLRSIAQWFSKRRSK